MSRMDDAARIASTYTCVIAPEPDVGYWGRTLELPLVMADGRTHAECAAQVLEATTHAVASMLEAGETPPPAGGGGKRTEQINIRLTTDELLTLKACMRRFGYRTLSDFIRTTALVRANSCRSRRFEWPS